MSATSKNLWTGYRWRESGWTRARAVLSLGMVFGLGAVGTMAYWTDDATATTGTFSVASLDLQVNDETAYTEWALAGTGMMPGDTKAATLNVQNNGGVDLTYTAMIGSSGDTALAPFMAMTVRSGATLNSGSGTCTGGTEVGSNTLQVGANKPLITTARSLSSDVSETLCFQVQISNAVSKTVSNQAVKAIVEFTATV